MTRFIRYLKGDHEGRFGEIAEVSDDMADSLIKDAIAIESNKEMYDKYCWSKVEATDCFGNVIKPFKKIDHSIYLPELPELPSLSLKYVVLALKGNIMIESKLFDTFEEVIIYTYEVMYKLKTKNLKIQIGFKDDEENSR